MDNEQLSIFEYMDDQEKNPIANTTCVVMNGECKNITWHELFDFQKYDTLDCITYVSSGDFFSKAINGFEKVRLIIGIEKAEVQNAIYQSIIDHLNDESIDFFEKLPEQDKEKLLNGNIEIKFPKVNCIVHSKFYLLSNSQNGNTRLIMGSANLTNTAFDNKFNQYEDVTVKDNSPEFDIYVKRFEIIYSQTVDYISKEICERYKQGKIVSVMDMTSDEKTEAMINRLMDENIVPVCNESILEMAEKFRKEQEKSTEKAKTTFEIIAKVSKKKKGENGLVLKSKTEIKAMLPQLTDILFKQTKNEMDLHRFALTYNDANNCQYRVYAETENREAEKFDRIAQQEEIKNSITNILKFVEAYYKFTTDNDKSKKNLSRIFEIIIYSFMSAYIFKLRQETTGNKADIPIILVIAGRAASGKSNMLAFIDRLLSGRRLEYGKHYLQYKQVNRGTAIADLFASDNTYPLFVDEVAPNFFSSQSGNKGEELIKYLSNTLDGKHPVMICTTNTGAFNIPAQVARRIYFLKVDACFDPKLKSQANIYYDAVMEAADNILFKDFCARMSEKIGLGENLFTENTADFLGIAREIFAEYFKISNIELPQYFPNDLYNDYEDRGIELWKTLYKQNKRCFKYEKKKNGKEATLTVNIKDLAVENRDTQVYMNYLRQDVLVEEAGMYVVLKAKEFYEWIGEKKYLIF